LAKIWPALSYFIGATNYHFNPSECSYNGANMTCETVDCSFWGDVDTITSYNNFGGGSGSMPLGEGNYSNLVVAGSNGDYTWVKNHDGMDAFIKVRFTDGGNLDVTRTFSSANGFGSLCGEFFQMCWGAPSSFSKCGNWPNTTGCSYSPMSLHKSKTCSAWVQ
jgi:hypothetical protein